MLFGNNQSDVAAFAQIHHAHFVGFGILKDMERVPQKIELGDRLVDVHGRKFERLGLYQFAFGHGRILEKDLLVEKASFLSLEEILLFCL